MILAPGTRLGPYEIIGIIGAGGMGEVYRATDVKLGRHVAIKVLPEEFASDQDRLRRFDREAKTLAALNHPNIATIYGLEERASVSALVMEIVEGEDLSTRIARGAIPFSDALPIARQIADALEAAHEQGIVHRDLKPANIKVRDDGTVKVLDFGLAKAKEPAGASDDAGNDPTITSPAVTKMGMILGTAAYMSPEQARGQNADRRSDVWAFGCVLFEMLSGRRAIEATGVHDTLAAVLRGEPNWAVLPESVPAHVRTLMERCLQKDRRQRLRDIGDARLELHAATAPPTAARSLTQRERLVWMAATAVAVVVAVGVGMRLWGSASRAAPVEFDVPTPPSADYQDVSGFAVSPDGARLVYTAPFQGEPHLWLRGFESADPTVIRGTAGAGSVPAWSPDGRSLAFMTYGELKRVDLNGGLVQRLGDGVAGWGISWSVGGVIIVAPSPASPIFRFNANIPGPGTPVTTLLPDHAGHVGPVFLPDGRHFLFYALGPPGSMGIYVGDIEGGPAVRLLDADGIAAYAEGWLFAQRKGRLYAWPFDASRRQVDERSPRVVSTRAVGWPSAAGRTIAFRPSPTESGSGPFGLRQFAWLDRDGKELKRIGDADPTGPLSPELSPDDRAALLLRRVNGNADVWKLELGRGTLDRLTDHVMEDIFPIWGHEPDSVIFMSNREKRADLFRRPLPGAAGSEKKLIEGSLFANDVTRDGRYLLYQRFAESSSQDRGPTHDDLYVRDLVAGSDVPVAATDAREREGRFSPDGRWIAYYSDRSGRFEVYVRPFPGPGEPIPISSGGGALARWRRSDGGELFYLALDGTLMAVKIDAAADGRTLKHSEPEPLFRPETGRVIAMNPGAQYAPSSDGKRFLVNRPTPDSLLGSIRVILNWDQAGDR